MSEVQAPQFEMKPFSLPAKFEFLFRPKRFKAAKGGRGSSKSWSFARALIAKAHVEPLRVLCVREFQNSIEDSVHKLLAEQIANLGVERDFTVQQRSITSRVGSQFIFAGCHRNITKIKSMEGIDICWVEEAETITSRSWEILIPTIRKDGSEIWVTWNPDEEDAPTDQRFVKNPPPNAEVVTVNWQDNPFFNDVMREEKDYLYRVDPEAAAHVWGGNYRKNGAAQIFRNKYQSYTMTPDRLTFTKWKGPYFGADWGFSNDPTTLIKVWLFERTLYIESEFFGYGVENDDIAVNFKKMPDAVKTTIRADNSRPETINHVAKKGGLKIIAADKWKGSVEDGIQFLRSFEKIVINPECRHMLDEARLYSYKVDKLTADVTTDIVDAHNHGWDAVRYAIEPLIQRKRSILDVL